MMEPEGDKNDNHANAFCEFMGTFRSVQLPPLPSSSSSSLPKKGGSDDVSDQHRGTKRPRSLPPFPSQSVPENENRNVRPRLLPHSLPRPLSAANAEREKEEELELRIEAEVEPFECHVRPLPPGAKCSATIWRMTQTADALDTWLIKHLGNKCSFTPTQLSDGFAIQECLKKQREKIRQRLSLEDRQKTSKNLTFSSSSSSSSREERSHRQQTHNSLLERDDDEDDEEDDNESTTTVMTSSPSDADLFSDAPPTFVHIQHDEDENDDDDDVDDGAIEIDEAQQNTIVEKVFPTYPVRRIPKGWVIRDMFCINIPDEAMRYNATSWADFDAASSRGLAHKTLLYMIARALEMSSYSHENLPTPGKKQSHSLGIHEPPDSESTNEVERTEENRRKKTTANNPPPHPEDPNLVDSYFFNYQPDGPTGSSYLIPKTSQVVEEVLSITGEHKGWRIFIYVHDKDFNLAQQLDHMMAVNHRIRHRDTLSANRKLNPRQRDKEREAAKQRKTSSICYENATTPKEFLKFVVGPYMSNYDEKIARQMYTDISREQHPVKIASSEHPLHPKNFMNLETAIPLMRKYGVCYKQTQIERYRKPVSAEFEAMVEKAIACEETEFCATCNHQVLKSMFDPMESETSSLTEPEPEPEPEEEREEGENDSDYHSTPASSDQEGEDMDSNSQESVPDSLLNADAPLGSKRKCAFCALGAKICVKCGIRHQLYFYDDARSPICKGCRWYYCFPRPGVCWRIPTDEIVPENLGEMHLPRISSDLAAVYNTTSEAYGRAMGIVDSSEGGTNILDSTADEDLQRWEEAMIQGSDRLMCPSLDPMTATLTSLDDRIVERSRMLQLRHRLLPERIKIESNYINEPKRYQEMMAEFKAKACLEFWNTIWECEPAQEFSAVERKGMAFLRKQTPDRIWPEHNQTFRNLSLYGNMRLFMHQNFTRHFRLKEGLMPRALWKLLLVRDSALKYDYGLHVNLLEDGEGSTGKSYNMDCMTELSFEGSIHKTTHISDQAFNTNKDWNYLCIVMHECPLKFLGVDQYGHPVEGSEFIKDRLTSNVTQADRANWQNGQADRSNSFSRCMGNMIMATNTNPPPMDTPLMQRFLREVIIKTQGGDYDVADIAEPMGKEMDEQTRNLFVHESRITHIFAMIVERAIEAGFLHDVNTNLVVMYFKRIFARLHEVYKIPKTPIRVRHMLLELCRTACIKHAVNWEYCTELNLWRFKNDGRTYRDFDPNSLINLERKLVVTEEMICDILSLFQDSFIPTLTQKFLQTCKGMCGLKDNSKELAPSFYKRTSPGPGRRDALDRNYAEFDYGSIGNFNDRINNFTTGQLTGGIINAKLAELTKRFIVVEDRNQVRRPNNNNNNNGGNTAANREHQAKTAEEQQQQQQPTKIAIPCAEIIQKPGSRRAQSVCIAIEAMYLKLDETALSETIKWVFSHAFARTRRIISSFVHVDQDGHSYPHLLDTIDIEKVENRVLSVPNHLALTRMDEALVYNRVLSNTYHTRNACMSADFITVWGEDAEISTFKMHWETIGAYWKGWNEERFKPMVSVGVWDLPWVYMTRLWDHRDRNKETYRTLIEFQKYPEEPKNLYLSRKAATKKHRMDVENGEKGNGDLALLFNRENNPDIALNLYQNWGLTYKSLTPRMKLQREEVRKWNDETCDPFLHMPEIERSAVVNRNREENIEDTKRVQSRFSLVNNGDDDDGDDHDREEEDGDCYERCENMRKSFSREYLHADEEEEERNEQECASTCHRMSSSLQDTEAELGSLTKARHRLADSSNGQQRRYRKLSRMNLECGQRMRKSQSREKEKICDQITETGDYSKYHDDCHDRRIRYMPLRSDAITFHGGMPSLNLP